MVKIPGWVIPLVAGLRITVDVPLDPKADCPADGAIGSLALQTISVSLG